jgi:hypothetical protein
MKFITFIADNWDSVAALLAVLWGAIALVRQGELSKLKAILFKAVTDAEWEYGGGTGELKLAQVISWIYERLPAYIKPFISESTLKKLVNEAVEFAKLKWESNPRLKALVAVD